ncbi:MAG: ABC transporter ATP-binding protein [Proteobacteria bacterium]|nr:ABC transporter ATP-binding protein [Pseudomonadota bacterium]
MSTGITPALEVTDLRTHFFTKAGVVKAVDGVSFSVAPGEIMGLVGESGSGKTVTGFSILGLVDPPGRIVEGSIRIEGDEIVGLPRRALQDIRGRRVSMIFQDPMMTLNPVLRIDTQMTEAIHAHEKVSNRAATARALEALQKVGIPAPEERLKSHPHLLSGGMRQRVAIAIALLNRPAVIIADEPTTALDVTIQGQILAEIRTLAAESGTAIVWVTHDLSVVAGLADKISVMYAGRIVESGSVDDVLDRPVHPYTRGLLDSVPQIGQARGRLNQFPGMTPSLLNLPEGCPVQPRCSRASALCRKEPALTLSSADHYARCHHPLSPADSAPTPDLGAEVAPAGETS